MRSPGEAGGRPSLTRLAMLLALGLVLHVVESAFLGPLSVPGVKLGLANIVSVLAILAYGWRWGLLLGLARVALGSLITGTLLSLGFMLALSGAVTSCLVMAAARRVAGDRLGTLGLSVLGALTHNLAQLGVFALWARQAGVFYYLPPLMLVAVPTGVLTGAAAAYLWRRWPGLARQSASWLV